MTSIEWLLSELEKVNYHPTEAMIMYAKKLEKQQIIDAYANAVMKENNSDYIGMHEQSSAEIYFAETYGSKGSDEFEKTNSQRFDEFMQLVTSSQTEISDEEIERFANEELGTIRTDFDFGVIQGMKWYREQLKQL